jgi:hypothetical protein
MESPTRPPLPGYTTVKTTLGYCKVASGARSKLKPPKDRIKKSSVTPIASARW